MRPPIRGSTPATFEGPASSDTEESHLYPDGESEDTTEQLLKIFICKNSTALLFYPLLTGTSLSLLNENETTLSIEPNATDTCPEVKSTNAGYKLIFDNPDKSIKPRYMRQDSQKIMLHYVQAYAVRDQINYSSISQEQRSETNLYKEI